MGETGLLRVAIAEPSENQKLPLPFDLAGTPADGREYDALKQAAWDHSSMRARASPTLMQPRGTTFAVMPPKPRVALYPPTPSVPTGRKQG